MSSSSCGLKNSGCPEDGSLVAEADDVPSRMYRFNFVDGIKGLWTEPTTGGRGTASNYDNITCPVGGMVVFYYPVGESNVVQTTSEEDWQSCNNLENATLLSPSSLPEMSSTFSDISYYHPCTEPGAIDYITSSIPGQCENNQRVIVQTSDSVYAENETTGEWDLHVESLTRVLTLLGYRQQPQEGEEDENIVVMDRGYQTEDLANTTTELIWCGMDHCPEFALDWDTSAAQADCESIIFTLLGFVNRKRPVPQWNRSEHYYLQAIERNGSNECADRSYLTQMYMNKRDFVNASSNVASLCEYCSEERGVISQAKSEYDHLGITEFDFDRTCGVTMDTSSGTMHYNMFTGHNWVVCVFLVLTFMSWKN